MMICYGPRLTTIAAVGIVCYVFLHKTIGRILEIAGLVLEITLITVAVAATAWLVIWAVRGVKRRRAAMGACATCRFRCQQALHLGARAPVSGAGRPGGPGRRILAPRRVTATPARPAPAPSLAAAAQPIPLLAVPPVPAPRPS